MANDELKVRCELIDLRTILPWDVETIAKVCCIHLYNWYMYIYVHVCNYVFELGDVIHKVIIARSFINPAMLH